jgi:hypothetical protein
VYAWLWYPYGCVVVTPFHCFPPGMAALVPWVAGIVASGVIKLKGTTDLGVRHRPSPSKRVGRVGFDSHALGSADAV